MKKLLAFLFGSSQDTRVSYRQLTSLQASGYFVEDVTHFMVDANIWR